MTYSEIIQEDAFILFESLWQGFYLRIVASFVILLIFNFLFFKYLYKLTKQSFALVFVIVLNLAFVVYFGFKAYKVASYRVFISESVHTNNLIELDIPIFVIFIEEYYWDLENQKSSDVIACYSTEQSIQIISCPINTPRTYYVDYMNIKTQEILQDSLSNSLESDSLIHLIFKRGIWEQEAVTSPQSNLLEQIRTKLRSELGKVKELNRSEYEAFAKMFQDKFYTKIFEACQQSFTSVKENYRTVIFLKIKNKNIPILVTRSINGNVFYEAKEEDLAPYFD